MARRGGLRQRIRVLERELVIRTSVGKKLLARYPYSYEPDQLAELCDLLDEVKDLDGAAIEVGCARGDTTVYLNRHLATTKATRPYYCLDTFSGFTDSDVAVERGRGKQDTFDDFDINSKSWFETTMAHNGLTQVTTIQADCATFDYSSLPPLVFGLIDVDLYRPMSEGLRRAYARLVPGGVLVADDCKPYVNKWDGALQAYTEVADELGLPHDIRWERLGVLHKPLDA